MWFFASRRFQVVPPDRRRLAACRPRFDGLEDRVLLSGNPTVYTVTDSSDDATDTGSLRYAIMKANANTNPAGSVIQFSPTVFNASAPRTITLSSTLKLSETAGPEVVNGPGVRVATVSGNRRVEVFSVSAGTTASISGLTIANGWGAFAGNPVIPGGGAGAGGINNAGTLTIAKCSVTHDASTRLGAIFSTGTMTILASTIANNFANASGQPFESAFGGGIDNAGTMTIANSTIVGNSAYHGGGIYNTRSLKITNSTIAGNQAFTGGGIDNAGRLLLNNTIVADGPSAGDIANSGKITGSHNLIEDGSGGLAGTIKGNAKLGSLAFNGGPTQTMALLTGSPAIGAGSIALAVDAASGRPLATDQRGAGFPRIVRGRVDIGAFEKGVKS
jgi:hypothetical protein